MKSQNTNFMKYCLFFLAAIPETVMWQILGFFPSQTFSPQETQHWHTGFVPSTRQGRATEKESGQLSNSVSNSPALNRFLKFSLNVCVLGVVLHDDKCLFGREKMAILSRYIYTKYRLKTALLVKTLYTIPAKSAEYPVAFIPANH